MGDLSFLNQEAPSGYVAGLGRGATGFVTSAETGPATFLSNYGFEVEEYSNETGEDGLLSVRKDAENEEADKIYEEIEARMQSRHRKRANVSTEKADETNTEVSGDFKKSNLQNKLKLDLNQVSISEWVDLPEVGDLTRKNKRQRILEQQQQRVYATPDVLIAQANVKNTNLEVESEVKGHGEEEGTTRAANSTNYEVHSARITNFGTDPAKERSILASLRKAEPKNPNLWISSARYEEQAKQFLQARSYIEEGCSQVPNDPEVWIESIRLHKNEGTYKCKGIANRALSYNSGSEELWLAALNLEHSTDFYSRKKILLKSLEALPGSAILWNKLVESVINSDETEKAEKIRLLENATKMCPSEFKFWELLVSLSDYPSAKQILNSARKAAPQEVRIWIAALKLEERVNEEVNSEKLLKMLIRGKAELEKKDVNLNSIDWIQLAVSAFEEHYPKTADVIVIDRLLKLLESLNCEELIQNAEVIQSASVALAATAYEYICGRFPQELKSWTSYLEFSFKFQIDELFIIYEKSLKVLENEELYLKYANDKKGIDGDVNEVNTILEKGLKSFPASEKLWIAQLDLNIYSKQFTKAIQLAQTCVTQLGKDSNRVWLKYIHILRFAHFKRDLSIGNTSLIDESRRALKLHPQCLKLHLQQSQILQDMGENKMARDVLVSALKQFPKSAILWSTLAEVDYVVSGAPKARSVLDKGLLENPKLETLWVKKIELEESEKDFIVARQLLSKSLQLFPSSASLRVINLRFIPKASHRKVAYKAALEETNYSPEISLAIGVFLWIAGKSEKTKTWFDSALETDQTNGDSWAWSYQYVARHGTQADQEKFFKLFNQKFDKINSGKVWIKVKKNPRNLDLAPNQILTLVGKILLKGTNN